MKLTVPLRVAPIGGFEFDGPHYSYADKGRGRRWGVYVFRVEADDCEQDRTSLLHITSYQPAVFLCVRNSQNMRAPQFALLESTGTPFLTEYIIGPEFMAVWAPPESLRRCRLGKFYSNRHNRARFCGKILSMGESRFWYGGGRPPWA